ncbi:MAG: cytochrome c, partial [Burkholderiales bacterium]
MSSRRIGLWALASAAVIGALAAGVVALNLRGEGDLSAEIAAAQPPGQPASAELLARGAYLARTGNCMACHTS